MIIYAAMVNESVISLFIAGIVPGIVLSLLFMIFIFLRVAISPRLAPADRTTRLTTGTVLHELSQCWAVLVLIAAIIGGMYFGIVTPTEAAAFGCAAALVIGLAYRDLSWDDCGRALLAAVVTTCSVVFIIVMGSILSFAVVDAGISRGVTKLLTQSQLGRFEFFLFLFLLYLVLGMFLDGIAMMLLTIPILYPAVIAFGFDGIWFGVILVVVIELGALTPPMGLNLFAIHSVSGGQPLAEIIRGSAPFAAIISGFCFLLYAFPQIALILPRSLK
jgi:tripartite ATP-independent transporter DctM subunit